MYQIKNKIYADAGFVLKHNNKISYNFTDIDLKDVCEIKIDLEDMFIKGNFIVYSNGLLKEINSCKTYGEWKSKIIHKQFNNDDQIAIMLNKEDSEEDLLLYNKMQEWRKWAGVVAKKIENLK